MRAYDAVISTVRIMERTKADRRDDMGWGGVEDATGTVAVNYQCGVVFPEYTSTS